MKKKLIYIIVCVHINYEKKIFLNNLVRNIIRKLYFEIKILIAQIVRLN